MYMFWKNYGFEIAVGISVITLIVVVILRKRFNQSGTWGNSDKYHRIAFPKQIQTARVDSAGEIECRKALEKIFNKPFPKIRPSFLNNPVTGGSNNLELDCFNEELKLAVEYNGRQHYEFIPFFHKNRESFLNQKYRDELKRRMCKDNGIRLIEIPYNVKINEIENYIIKHLKA